MLDQDLLAKIKQIEIHTRRLLSGTFVGDTRSSQKGTGFEFDQIREYQQGDDVRFIDWHASARMNKLLVKQYIQERSRTIILAVDVSGSSYFGSRRTTKHELLAQVASVLALVADFGRDNVALLLFTDEVELFLPPRSGRNHTKNIMYNVFGHEPRSKKTSIATALEYIGRLKRSDSMIFVLSDFIDTDYQKPLMGLVKRNDVIAIRVLDALEHQMPNVGILSVVDSEAGQKGTIDTRTKRSNANAFLAARILENNALFTKYGVDVMDITPGQEFIGSLIRFFQRRLML